MDSNAGKEFEHLDDKCAHVMQLIQAAQTDLESGNEDGLRNVLEILSKPGASQLLSSVCKKHSIFLTQKNENGWSVRKTATNLCAELETLIRSKTEETAKHSATSEHEQGPAEKPQELLRAELEQKIRSKPKAKDIQRSAAGTRTEIQCLVSNAWEEFEDLDDKCAHVMQLIQTAKTDLESENEDGLQNVLEILIKPGASQLLSSVCRKHSVFLTPKERKWLVGSKDSCKPVC